MPSDEPTTQLDEGTEFIGQFLQPPDQIHIEVEPSLPRALCPVYFVQLLKLSQKAFFFKLVYSYNTLTKLNF